MLFNIEEDTGDTLTFYIVPDDYSSVSRCRIVSDDEVLGVFDANEERMALVSAGRHETGMCGFRISSSQIAGLSNHLNLSILDDRTGIRIYSRPHASNVQKRLLRLETHLLPLWRFDQRLAPFFQYYDTGIDRHGRETSTQMFLLNSCASLYLSGRILYRNYAYYIEKGFDVVTLLQAPHAELAERLRVLALIKTLGGNHLGDRDQARLAPAIEFAASLSFQDPERLTHRLRQMPAEVELLLAEPLTRQLTSGSPDEMPGKGAVAIALDALANCRLIGFRDRPHEFASAVREFLGVSPGVPLTETIPVFDPVQPLAALLRETRILDHLVDRDLEIFTQVRQAYDAVH